MPAEITAMKAERAVKMSFKVHKLKARSGNIVETARLITEVCGPDFQIRVDPNTQFGDLETGLHPSRSTHPSKDALRADVITLVVVRPSV